MKAALLFLLAVAAHAEDFSLLSKADVKAFEASYASIEDAFKDRNLSPIASFGPSILSRYSALLLQADAFAKRDRPAYRRLDSLVAYAIVRLRLDSLVAVTGKASGMADESTLLRQVDRALLLLTPESNLCLLDWGYCDTTTSKMRAVLEIRLPQCVSALRAKDQEDRALELLSSIQYTSTTLKKTSKALESGVEKAFRAILSSSDRNEVLAFQAKYPTYRPEKVAERLSSLEADEMYHLLKSGARDDLVAFLAHNPSSPYVSEVQGKLEPLLFRAAVEEFDPAAGRQYLGLFSVTTDHGRKVAETLAWMLRPATDSVEGPVPSEPPRLTPGTDSQGPGADGPRTAPNAPPPSTLTQHELGRLGIGIP
jgi:hypothetical protein